MMPWSVTTPSFTRAPNVPALSPGVLLQFVTAAPRGGGGPSWCFSSMQEAYRPPAAWSW